MQIINSLDFKLQNSCVTLGKFDGIHKGHRYLFSQILNKKEYIPTVFTFDIETGKDKIYTQKEKDYILEKMGIEREIIFPFNENTKNISPEDFIKDILVDKIDAKYICVGEDFGFGKDRKGNVETLKKYQDKYGYELCIVPKLSCDGKVIGSTRIRELMEKGEIEKANILLSEPYFIKGHVRHGKALGRTFNLPTANLILAKNKKLLPLGVYATVVEHKNKEYYGVTNIGRKPTVGHFDIGVETFIMDFSDEIYGEEIKVSFYKFIRKERKFSDIDNLICQINKDKEETMKYFKLTQ